MIVEPLVVPGSLDGPGGDDFATFVELLNAQALREGGSDLVKRHPDNLLSQYQAQEDFRRAAFVAREGAAIIGVGYVEYDRGTQRTCEAEIAMDAAHESEQLADALWRTTEELARAEGRSVIATWSHHRYDEGGERIVPPTRAGSLRRDAVTQRLLRNGFALQQVDRGSVFDLHGSYEGVDALLERALETAGPDYRVEWWTGATPEEHLDGLAAAITRMSTDAPSGDMDVEETPWTADRLRRREARIERAGALLGVTAVIHVPTGTVAAFNELGVPADRSEVTNQYATLVLAEHRGRKLGSIVKCVGLKRWHEAVPTSPCVVTFNAEENRYMLDVNEAVGFTPIVSGGAWEKRIG
ncbi:GNAT family N-acetyltransferase [Microbacterium sp. Marseille-Q6965]|uniref:GNAT family N-acetyltransferase n=1 Tax=Microbacterium sp. Marseille-Q6965 TaxID=2965072 RepID=UPI0021B6FD0E|nr:GNAT family N-acetyltransferase [Microbacterium sp. Marseille-Q6965]